MLPPVDSTVLQTNPKFAALHATLTTTILNPNGSTKNHPSQKDRDVLAPTLRTAQLQSAKSQILIMALQNVELSTTTKPPSKTAPKQTQPLPSDLIEVILLLTSRLSSPNTPPTHIKLLETTPQWQSLPTHLPYLASLLSTYLQTQASALVRVLSPTTNPSFLHRSIPKLLPAITDLQHEITKKKEELHKQRNNLTAQTTILLQAYQSATALTIQLLETSKHGSLSLERHYLTKINYLALEVEKVELEAKEKGIKGEKMVYTPEVVEALGRYQENLRDARARLKDRQRQAERVLWGYGVGRDDGDGKLKLMKEIARVYGELYKEVRDVGKDVERLRGR